MKDDMTKTTEQVLASLDMNMTDAFKLGIFVMVFSWLLLPLWGVTVYSWMGIKPSL